MGLSSFMRAACGAIATAVQRTRKNWTQICQGEFDKKCRGRSHSFRLYYSALIFAGKGEGTIQEEKIIEKAKQGNEHAYRFIVETYRDHVFRTVYSVLRDTRDAEEAAQEVFVKVYYRLSQYERQGFKTWLTRMAVNYAIDLKRKVASRREDSIEVTPDQADDRTIEETILRKEAKQVVHKRLDDVPKNYRDVIIAFYLEEKSYEDIAIEQQVEVKTVETKLYRARKWLRKHWKEEDFR